VLNLTLIIPATACHQRNYVERYSRYRRETHHPCPCIVLAQDPLRGQHDWFITSNRCVASQHFSKRRTIYGRALARRTMGAGDVVERQDHTAALCRVWSRDGRGAWR